jgi:hypothetical protein
VSDRRIFADDNSVAPARDNLTLRPYTVAVPALASHVRPALVIPERESRLLLDAASFNDVHKGGRFRAGPAGVQVWDRPFPGPEGDPGDSHHLGSVDWSYDTPVRHYVTIYRAMVTEAGIATGETTLTILAMVLGLGGVPADGAHVTMAAPPTRDPFRRRIT